MPLNLLLLSRYDARGASSRLRTLQYRPALEARGFTVAHVPLFGAAYLDAIYHSGGWARGRMRSAGHVAAAVMRRVATVLGARRYDVIWIEKELFPYLPGVFEALLARTGIPYVVDYDDAIFHRYDRARSSAVRRLLSTKLDPLLAGAFAVTAGNRYLGDYARRHGARRVEWVPTVVDTTRYPHRPEPNDKALRIGWIGSPSTAAYLPLVHRPLREVASERPIRLVTVGAPPLTLPGVPIEQHEWSLESEAHLIGDCHVGIMPLRDSPWEQGKCGYKLIQYMACARPVVASPVGVNPDIVGTDAGFLAADDAAWADAFRQLAASPARRAAMGRAGRARVEESYALQVTAPRIAALLMEAATSRHGNTAA